MTRSELRPLTAVRGLFAWGVVLYHVRLAGLAWLPAGAMAVLAKGYLAVDFFFLLSGFVIWLNYGKRLAGGGRAVAADFWVRRLARIWPLHAFMLAFSALLALALLASGRAAPHFPFAELPLHLALMQDWGANTPLMWNDPSWSISAEWGAYLIVPPLALLVPHGERWRTSALLALAAAPLLLLHIAMALTGNPHLGSSIAHFGLPRCLAEFACGTQLCALWRRWRGDDRAELIAWGAGLACLGGWAAGVAETLAVPFAFAALLLALAIGAERPRHPLSGRIVHYLGEISYATYLSHFVLFFVFKLIAVRDARAVPPQMVGVFLLGVLMASMLLYHGIERPAQRVMLRWWRTRRDFSSVRPEPVEGPSFRPAAAEKKNEASTSSARTG